MVFYKEKHGNRLEFNDPENIVTYVAPNTETFHRTCLFGIIISADDCDAFSITFKWIKTEYKKQKYIMLGWITNGKEGSIKDWNQYGLGMTDNAEYSCGIHSGYGYLEFYLYKHFPSWSSYSIMENKTRMTHSPQEGDEFKLKFDFKNDKVEVYRNDILIADTSLDGVKEIMPALSLTYGGQQIQVIDWRFCKGDTAWS